MQLQFSDQLKVLDALSTVQEASSTELGKMMMDNAIERFHSLPVSLFSACILM